VLPPAEPTPVTAKADHRVAADAADRIAATAPERAETRCRLDSGELLRADSPQRLEKRKTRLLAAPRAAIALTPDERTALAGSPLSQAPPAARRAFERVLRGNDAQPCWFLTRGAEVRRTVGRIHLRDDHRRIGWGTGFLVAPRLLLTNQHVLDTPATAHASRVEFDYEETAEGDLPPTAVFDLEPDTLFVADPADGGLDYALVAVAERARPDCGRPDARLTEFGHNRLIAGEGKLAKGELINCVHHPHGQPRQLSMRENRLMAIGHPPLNNTWLHYETDTQPGSSGAPLFNDDWEVVGIHHSAVEHRDAHGHILAVGGQRWTADMGEHQIWWHVNEGLRISRLLAAITTALTEHDDATRPRPSGATVVLTDHGRALLHPLLHSTPATGTGTPDTPAPPPPTQPTSRPFHPE
jgi:endonuclease G